MDRRDALKSLAALAGATGMTVTPVTTKDAEGLALVVFKVPGVLSAQGAENIRRSWQEGMKGTPLEGIKALVMDRGIDVEFIRK